jgi:hypothetical protein
MVEFLALVAAAMLGFKCMKNPVILFPTITAVLFRKKLDVYALNAYIQLINLLQLVQH